MRLSSRSLMVVLVLLASAVLLAPTGSARRETQLQAWNALEAKRYSQRSVPKAPLVNQMDQLRSLGLRSPLLP